MSVRVQGLPEVTYKFGQIWTDIRRLAVFLVEDLKFKKNDRIILCYPPGLDFIIAFFACITTGIVAVPVYPPDPSKAKTDVPRFCEIMENSQTTTVLTNNFYRRVAQIISYAKDRRWNDTKWVPTNANDMARKIPAARCENFKFPELSPDHVAFLQFTSGSTSAPKGVMVTIGSLVHNCHLALWTFSYPTSYEDPSTSLVLDNVPFGDVLNFFEKRHEISKKALGHRLRCFSWLPVYHDMGLIGFACAPFLCGGTVVQMSPLDFIRHPWVWLQAMSRYDCVCCAAPNFAFELVCRKMPSEVYETLDLSKICGMLSGAEPVRSSTMEKFIQKFAPKGLRRCAFMPAYGLAENTLMVAARRKYDAEPKRLTVNVAKMREQAMVEEASPYGDELESQTLIGCGPPLYYTEGRQ
eukprot:GHVU01111818.1.p1 GENE.GHVU01111818.1~~GHVU01111818.1.p1  ORF type:complete len:410 (+),score=34.37 GHVU01111818.1:324-1553(+)